jgi:hypothetical protein
MTIESVFSSIADGHVEEDSPTHYDNAGSRLRLGKHNLTDAYNFWTVFNISPRSGDTLTSATLKLYLGDSGSSGAETVNGRFRCRDLASAAPPTDRTDYNTKKSANLTTNFTDKTIPAPLSNNVLVEVDITSAVQEVLDNQAGFDGTIEVWGFENGSGNDDDVDFWDADRNIANYLTNYMPTLELEWDGGTAFSDNTPHAQSGADFTQDEDTIFTFSSIGVHAQTGADTGSLLESTPTFTDNEVHPSSGTPFTVSSTIIATFTDNEVHPANGSSFNVTLVGEAFSSIGVHLQSGADARADIEVTEVLMSITIKPHLALGVKS